MEYLGTFALVYVAGLAVMMNDLGKVDLTGVAFAQFFVLSFMIWAGGSISGGHYNAAVTIALMCTSHINWKKGLLYILAQFLGSLGGAMLLGGFLHMYTRDPLVFKNMLGYPHANVERFGVGTCFLVEMFATFFLVFMVYALAVVNKPGKTEHKDGSGIGKSSGVVSLAIGGTLGMAVLTIGPITGAALNPWRVIAPSIMTMELWSNHYWYAFIYYIGCPVGGLLAALVWRFTFMKKDQEQIDDEALEEERVKNAINVDDEAEKLVDQETGNKPAPNVEVNGA